MDAKVYELINDQINKELYSAYLYLSFADYYEEEGLSGYANYFEIQAQEERDHAMIFRNYLHENGEAVKLLAIDMPDKTFANFLEPLEAAMEHEKYVTSLINDIYAAALEAHDYRAQKFLGWFIDEQLEEEDNADTMITNMKLFGGDPKGLYDLDQACAARIQQVLDTRPSVADRPETQGALLPAPRGAVEFRDVSFKYQAAGSGDDVLSHISFTVEPGKFLAIVGGTGTGKSSLVNLIPRFYDVTGGTVLVDGMDVRDYPLEELRGRIGMVLQTNVLFTGTIRENLLWGDPNATEEDMIRAAKDAQAYDFIMSFPDGFDTVLDQGGVNVSGGQKQRLCIARAMLRKPAILILDDSTSAVDSATEAAIRESFARNLKGTTVIMIAQRISSVQYADEIIILDDDHIAGQGTHRELLASNSIYQEIYRSQQEGVGE
mgnify:CR=1 FL=1